VSIESDDIAALLAERDAAMAMLESLEWSAVELGIVTGPHGSGGDSVPLRVCPTCGGAKPVQANVDRELHAEVIGHRKGCNLAALLLGKETP
jgi:hypothetical protein